MLGDLIEANKSRFICGADIDINDWPLVGDNRPFVRLKLNCSSPVEVQIYNSGILGEAANKICGYCGEDGERRPIVGETSIMLPCCDLCFTEKGVARSSGRNIVKNQIAGRRVERESAAKSRANAAVARRACMAPAVAPEEAPEAAPEAAPVAAIVAHQCTTGLGPYVL